MMMKEEEEDIVDEFEAMESLLVQHTAEMRELASNESDVRSALARLRAAIGRVLVSGKRPMWEAN